MHVHTEAEAQAVRGSPLAHKLPQVNLRKRLHKANGLRQRGRNLSSNAVSHARKLKE
jgi:hypothetical protein